MKPGFKTTEFWITVLTTAGTLFGAIAGALPGTASVFVSALAAGFYTLSRGLAKSGEIEPPSSTPGAY